MSFQAVSRFGPLVLLSTFALLNLGVRAALFVARTGRSPLAGKSRSSADALHGFLERCYLLGGIVLGGFVLGQAISPRTPATFGPIGALASPAVVWTGAALGAVAIVWVFAAQGGMGSSWRIGIPEGENTALVATGFFRFCRNPIYLGMNAGAAALFLMAPSTAFALLVFFTILLTQIQVRCEEGFLRSVHGEEYLDYGRRVGRFFPWWGRFPAAP